MSGCSFGEAAQPVHEPFRGEVRRGADGQHAGFLPLQQALGAGREPIEGIAHDLKIGRGPLR